METWSLFTKFKEINILEISNVTKEFWFVLPDPLKSGVADLASSHAPAKSPGVDARTQ